MVNAWKEGKCMLQNSATPLRDRHDKTIPLFPFSWLEIFLPKRFRYFICNVPVSCLVHVIWLLVLVGYFSNGIDKTPKPCSCGTSPGALLAAFPGKLIFVINKECREAEGAGAPSPSASRRREKPLMGCDLEEDALFPASRKSQVASSAPDRSFGSCFDIQISFVE